MYIVYLLTSASYATESDALYMARHSRDTAGTVATSFEILIKYHVVLLGILWIPVLCLT